MSEVDHQGKHMSKRTHFDDQIAFRIKKTEKHKFEETCHGVGRVPADMLREMINAFNDKRLKIKRENEMEIYQNDN